MIYFSDVDVVVKLAACGFLPWFPALIGHGEGEIQIQGYDILKRGGCEGMKHDGVLRLAFSSGLATQEPHAVGAIRSYFKAVRDRHGDLLADLET